jgi:arabinofuranan 3-O-arabinosyltransferase
MLMLASYLVSRPSYEPSLVVVVPLLAAGALEAGSVTRSPWFWGALVPQVPEFTFPYLDASTHRAFKDAVTLSGLALLLAARCTRPGPARRREQAAPPGHPAEPSGPAPEPSGPLP